MYIINPTKEQLEKWFSCNKNMGEYLIHKLGAVLIHKNNDIYYFVDSTSFKEKLKKVPFYLKVLEEIKNL